MRVLIAVTHLLGAGHLTRAAALARAFAAAGHETTLVSGGVAHPLVSAPRVRFVQLPPVRTQGTDFRALLDESGRPVDVAYRRGRREHLLAALSEARPDVVVTELFPFGRRALADEFLALIEAARAAPGRALILSSIRDVLAAPAKPDRVAETHARLRAFYDGVLAHGDERIAPLELSWPVEAAVKPLLHMTGYIQDARGEPVRAASERSGEVLVSGGSSAAGLPLYRAAVGAARARPDRTWRILVGSGVSASDFSALAGSAPANAVVERARPDFPRLLAGASVSVSQAGYNTVVDVLRARARAVLVPFEAGRETEQRLRAERLAALGLARVVPEADLAASTLAAAVEQALRGQPAGIDVRLDGAERSVRLVEGMRRKPAVPARSASLAWSALDAALRQAADAGATLDVWWRDDDAVAHTPALDRLIALQRRLGVPLALAVVPAHLDASLVDRLGDESVAVLVHGWRHANHAPAGAKKAEFGGHRPTAALAKDARAGLERLRAAMPAHVVPVFVPPWNRIAPDFVPILPRLDFSALSVVGGRESAGADETARIDVHVDPIDWRGTRGLADPDLIVSRLAGAVERRLRMADRTPEPIGLLTHHLVHDESVWGFCEALLDRLRGSSAVRFPTVRALLSHRGFQRH